MHQEVRVYIMVAPFVRCHQQCFPIGPFCMLSDACRLPNVIHATYRSVLPSGQAQGEGWHSHASIAVLLGTTMLLRLVRLRLLAPQVYIVCDRRPSIMFPNDSVSHTAIITDTPSVQSYHAQIAH
jgi:hypothetical protein